MSISARRLASSGNLVRTVCRGRLTVYQDSDLELIVVLARHGEIHSLWVKALGISIA